MSGSNVVTFNVGGQVFQISQKLLYQFPYSKLARSALENNQKYPIFFDRDGIKFGLILDYMRDGKVYLPISVSVDAFKAELSFYDFHDIDTIPILCSIDEINRASSCRGFIEFNQKANRFLKKISKAHRKLETQAYCLNFFTEVIETYKITEGESVFEVFLGDASLLGKGMFTYCNEHLKDIGITIHANGFKHLYEDDGSLSRACIVNISINPLGTEKRRHEKIIGSSLEEHRKRRALDTCYSDSNHVDDYSVHINVGTHINEAGMKVINGASTVSNDSIDISSTSSKVENAKLLKEDMECYDSVGEEAVIKMESNA